MKIPAVAPPAKGPGAWPKALAIALLPVLLTGCGPGESSDPSAAKTTAIVGIRFDIQTVNPLIDPGSGLNDTITDQLFLSLLEESPDYAAGPPSYEPRLAESFRFSDDRLVLTLSLDPAARWSDGTAIRARDVVFTWRAQIDPEVAWPFADLKSRIEDVSAVDDLTVEFKFTEAYGAQLADANEGPILPAHVWGELPLREWRASPQWFEERMVVSGPFELESWQRSQQFTLARNEQSSVLPIPALERIVFRIVPDGAALVEQLLAGDVHFMRNPAATDYERLEQSDRVRLIEYPSRTFTYVVWNVERPFFDDPRTRRALELAADRQSIIDTVHRGRATIGTSPFVSWAWPQAEASPAAFDPARARELLAEAGWRDENGDGVRERDGVAFRFELSTNQGNEPRWQALQMLQAQFADVGVDAVPVRLEYGRLNQANFAHEFDATLMGLSMDTNHDLSYTFHSEAADNGGFNFGSFQDAELDRLIVEVNAALDKRDLEPQLRRIQAIFREQQPVLFLWEPAGVVALSRQLQDVAPDATSELAGLYNWRFASH